MIRPNLPKQTPDGRKCQRWSAIDEPVNFINDLVAAELFPIPASKLVCGDSIIARESWFGVASGAFKLVTVQRVTLDEWEQPTVTLGDGSVETIDDGATLWIVPAGSSSWPALDTIVGHRPSEFYADDLSDDLY